MYLILHRLRVHSSPLNIVYNPATVALVKQFITAPLRGRGREKERGVVDTPLPSTGLRIRRSLGNMLQGDANKVSFYGWCVCVKWSLARRWVRTSDN